MDHLRRNGKDVTPTLVRSWIIDAGVRLVVLQK